MKKFDELTYTDMDTPRYRRARRTCATMLSAMRDFIPNDRECGRRMEDYLMRLAYESNSEIISVPPEWDELDKVQLEQKMLETKMAQVIPARIDP